MTKNPQPVIPEIKMCPRCGNKILIGDTMCSRCGYRVQQPLTEQFKKQPPNVVAITAFTIGVLLTIAATGMDDLLQIFVLLLGMGCVVGGGLYYAAHLLLTSDDRRSKK